MATESSGGVVSRVVSTLDAGNLATEILRPERRHAIVCVTTPSWASEPLLNAEALAAALGEAAAVYVLRTGDASWELTDRLPPRLDVYGGATRVWWPDVGASSDPYEHPLFLVHDRSESAAVTGKVLEAFKGRGLLAEGVAGEGSETGAVVTALSPRGAYLTLTAGTLAFAQNGQLTKVAGVSPDRVVRPGQAVRVVVTGPLTDGRVPVSLRPFEPDAWERVADQYREGMLVEGVVDELRNFGAFVTLLPGARALLHKSQITTEWVSHPEDHLERGERLVVRITGMNVAEKKVDVSLLGVAEDAEPDLVASIYPDGPPWLEPFEFDDAEDFDADLDSSDLPTAVTVGSLAEEGAGRDVRVDTDESEAAAGDAVPNDVDAGVGEPPEDTDADPDGITLLENVIADGRELQTHVAAMFASAEQRLSKLRSEAAQIRQGLERDLSEARLRLLEFAEGEIGGATGSTEAALARARDDVLGLRAQLDAAEEDRRHMVDRLKTERERAADAERRATRLRKELQTERQASDALRGQVEALQPDPGQRLLDEIHWAWRSSGTDDDRERYPWHDPDLGPELLESVAKVQGISRERVVEVCSHVVSGRAAEIAGLELHPLRTSEVGSAPQRVREDGAKAWRCNLQTGTPAARRLHYWQLPDGRVELAKIVYHDDFSIR